MHSFFPLLGLLAVIPTIVSGKPVQSGKELSRLDRGIHKRQDVDGEAIEMSAATDQLLSVVNYASVFPAQNTETYVGSPPDTAITFLSTWVTVPTETTFGTVIIPSTEPTLDTVIIPSTEPTLDTVITAPTETTFGTVIIPSTEPTLDTFIIPSTETTLDTVFTAPTAITTDEVITAPTEASLP